MDASSLIRTTDDHDWRPLREFPELLQKISNKSAPTKPQTTPTSPEPSENPENSALRSPKKYGVAVCLSAIFGLLGIHHFYLGRWLHGLIDLSMTIGAFTLIMIVSVESPNAVIAGVLLLAVDIIHTIIITILLLTGSYKDGSGKIVAYPNQKLT